MLIGYTFYIPGGDCPGRAAAINVKSLDVQAGIRGTYRRKRLRVPCMYMRTLAHHCLAAESTYRG
jgi:hypothetical protein